MSGCASYSIEPIPAKHTQENNIEIYSFSYHMDNFDFTDKGEFEKLTLSSTKNILKNSVQVIHLPDSDNIKKHYYLEINIKQKSGGGACSQEYLTGLSLGLIPSWCTRHDLYHYLFKLYRNSQLCSKNEFSVDETSYSHLIFLPVGLIQIAQGVYSEPVKLYEEALTSFVYAGCL